MANVVNWEAAWASQSNVMSTLLNSLADNTRTAAGTEYDNSSGLDQYACLELILGSYTPSGTDAAVYVYMVQAPDGTNYEDGSATVTPGSNNIVWVVPIIAATAAVRKVSAIFPIPPAKIKFLVENQSNAAFASSGCTMVLYTTSDEIQ